MKSYLKFLSRNKLYTAIEAVGLIVSLAFVIVIGFSVWDQLMIAKKVPGEQNLYLLGPQKDLFFMEYRDKETLASIPEILEMASFQKTELTVQGGEEFRQMPVLIADSNLLEMLRIGVRSGSVDPLRHGQGVALTASAAARMFPDKDPVGQSLTIGAEGFENYGEHIKEAAEIVAVIDAPDHSILDDFDVFCPMEGNLFAPKTIREANIRENGTGRIVYTFATMVEGVDLEAFSEKYVSLIGDTINRDAKDGLMATDYRELYFSTDQIRLISGIRHGNRLYLYIMLILGLVLLLSAVLNYVNLSSAISGSRAKEMATRRLLGDSKQRVFWRIMLETLLFTLVCYVLAVLLASAITPYLNSIRPEDIPVAFRVAPTFGFWLLSIAFILLVSLVSGLLPAVLLSSYRPVDVISGNIRRRRKMGFNKVCIVIQSLLALVLICLSITLHAQLRHLETLDLGIDPQENLFYYHPNWFYSADMQVLGDKLSNLPQIKRMGYASGIPTHVGMMSSGPQKSTLNLISCDTLAFKLLGFRIREPFSQVKPGTIWISDELRNFSGVGPDSLDVSLVLPYNSGKVSEIGGVIEDFRKLAVNADDHMSGHQQFRAVEIPFNEAIKGILMETGPDHDAFKREFTRVVTEHYKSTIGVPDLTTSTYNQCGYLDEIIAADYASLHRFVQIITLVGLIAVFLAMLGLVAMSAWFAGQNAKEIAIRKVFGSDERSETLRSVRSYMILTLLAAAIGIPVAIVLIRRFLESYPERISGYWWIFALALAISLAVSFVSVLWQTFKAAKTNPAVELKKE